MDLQTFLDNAVKAGRSDRLKESDQITLGELIAKIEPIAEKQKDRIKEKKDEATVVFDFEYLFPSYIDSWRGSYCELALNFCTNEDKEKPMTVTKFLKMLKEAVGKTYTGYKGGDFTMGKTTPIWVANYGNSGNTALIEVIDNEYEVILMTGYREF